MVRIGPIWTGSFCANTKNEKSFAKTLDKNQKSYIIYTNTNSQNGNLEV